MIKLKIIMLFIFGLGVCSCTSPQLMSYTDFSKLAEIKFPKELNLKSKEKNLLYIGTYHSNDIQDTLFSFIQKKITAFQPDYVLHEGGNNWPIYEAIDSTILISGEPGFLIQLCQNQKIAYNSIEPSQKKEYAYLLGKYELNWVVMMYLCRQVDQQQRFAELYKTTNEAFEMNIEYFLGMLVENGIPLKKQQLKYAYWKGEYKRLMKKDLEWRNFNPAEYYPNYYLTKMNEVNRSSDEFRNLFMVEKVFTSLQKYNKVLVLVGGGHLIVQEKLLIHKFKRKFKDGQKQHR